MPRSRTRGAKRKEQAPKVALDGLKNFLSDIHALSEILINSAKKDGELANRYWAGEYRARQVKRKKAAEKRARKAALRRSQAT